MRHSTIIFISLILVLTGIVPVVARDSSLLSVTPSTLTPGPDDPMAGSFNVAVGKPVIERKGGITYDQSSDVRDFNSTTDPGGGNWLNETNTGDGTYEIVDLRGVYDLNGIGFSLTWDGAYANPLTFQVDVSIDYCHWDTVYKADLDPAQNVVDVDVPFEYALARYVRYWEPPDGDWNGWGNFFELRAYSATPEPRFPLDILTMTPPFYTPTPTLVPTPTVLTPTPSPTASDILAVGGRATVNVLGTDTLNVRTGPGTEFALLEKLVDGTQVTLLEGPKKGGDYVWWRVCTPSGIVGWVVESADGIQTLIP